MKTLKLIGLSLFSALTIMSFDNAGDKVRPQTGTDIADSTSVLGDSSLLAKGTYIADSTSALGDSSLLAKGTYIADSTSVGKW